MSPPNPHHAASAAPPPAWRLTPEEFAAWVESTILQHYRQLCVFALSLAGNEAAAADLTQQTAVNPPAAGAPPRLFTAHGHTAATWTLGPRTLILLSHAPSESIQSLLA